MKHILNNLSADEKNSILEQHTGGMKVITENFSKLLNSKLGDSKPLVKEQEEGYEEQDINRRQLMLRNKSAEVVSNHLNNLSDSITFIAIINCEYADFSGIDICGIDKLMYINLVGTDNNFEEQGYECAEKDGDGFYSLIDIKGQRI